MDSKVVFNQYLLSNLCRWPTYFIAFHNYLYVHKRANRYICEAMLEPKLVIYNNMKVTGKYQGKIYIIFTGNGQSVIYNIYLQ